MRRVIRPVLAMWLAGFYLIQIGAQPNTDLLEDLPLDSVLNWMITNETTDSLKIHEIGLNALKRARENGDHLITGQLHQALASWIDYHGLIPQDSVVYHDRKALEYFTILNDSLKIAKMHQVLSIDEMNLGLYVKARKSIFKAISIFEAMDNKDGLANAYRSLANLFTFTNESESAIKYGKMALEYYQGIEDHYRIAITYLPLMQSYMKLDSSVQAHKAADQCIITVDTHLPEGQYIKARALSHNSDAYIQQTELDSALSFAQQSYELVAAAVGRQRASSYSEPIAEILMMKDQYQEALTYYLPIVETADEQNIENLYPMYKNMAICYEKVGDYKNALAFERRRADIQIDIEKKKILNLESEAFVKYETQLKDQAIAAHKAEIKQNTFIQLIGLSLLLMLSGLLFFLIRLFLKNKKITQALAVKNKENEFLIKEIHHRVKNNLQILSSLLSLQSNYIQDEQAADAIKEGRNRVESMGLIHQRLYQGANKMAIDLNEYISDLCSYLSDSFLLESQNISIGCNVFIGKVDVETAIPLGLVVNELITNSIKYGFKDKSDGNIDIKIWVNEKKQLCLLVKDNGSGVQPHSNPESRSSNFGTDLVNVLIKKLKGTLHQESEDGFSTLIFFDRYQLSPAEQAI